MQPYVNFLGHPLLAGTSKILQLKQMAAVKRADRLQKAQTIGIPPDHNANDLARLVPQNLGKVWTAETNTNEDLVISYMLPPQPVFSTKFEYVVVEDWGGGRYQTHFVGEDALPGVNKEKIREDYAYVKLFADRRQIGMVAQTVGLIGGINPGNIPIVERSGLQFVTANMIRSQVTEWERALLWGDEDVDPKEFDGIIAQIKKKGLAGLNVHDMRDAITGQPGDLTFERVLFDISAVGGPPYFAKIEVIGMTDLTWAMFQSQVSDGGRWLQDKAGNVNVNGWTFNPGSQTLVSPRRKRIEFLVVPFLAPPLKFPDANVNTPNTTVTSAVIDSSTAGADADSMFVADDEGVYIYGFVYIFANGASAGFISNGVSVTEGDVVTHVMLDSGTLIGSATNPIRKIETWRSAKDGTEATLKYMRDYAPQNVSGHTEIVDDNSIIAGTDVALGLMFKQGAIFEAKLLDTTRFAIPYNTGFGTDVACVRIGTPVVAHYNRQLCWYNIRRPAGVLA